MIRARYLFTEKKIESLRLRELTPKLLKRGIEWQRADLDGDIGEAQLIVHKVTDLIVDGGERKPFPELLKASPKIAKLQEYLRQTGCKLVEPFEVLENLIYRDDMLRMLGNCVDGCFFRVPEYSCSVNKETVEAFLPAIVKNIRACASNSAHSMWLLKEAGELDQVTSSNALILQRFIPHYGVLIKVYVVKDDFHVQLRPSIDLNVGHFNSQKIPKTFDEEHSAKLRVLDLVESKEFKDNLFKLIVNVRLNCSGLSLFGMDLLLSELDHSVYVIDINYFPGFTKYPDFDEKFANLLKTFI